MKFLDIARRSRSMERLFLSCSALALSLAGCASPRPPRPPSLDLPETVKDLAAERTGDQVILHWTTPDKTTDRLEIKGTITAEICRIDHPLSNSSAAAGHPAPPCTPVTRLPVHPGPAQVSVTLPPTLISDPATLLAFRVQLFNLHGRSSGLSPRAYAAAGAAPPPVERLRASSVPTGAMLEWLPQTTDAGIELDRLLATPPVKNPRPAKSPTSPTGSAPAPQSRSFSAKPQQPPANEVKLETPALVADPGGTLDSTAARGETYIYTARRVRIVSLEGHPLTLRSLTSVPVTLTVSDTFPPAVPGGLEAVPGGVTTADRSIDLSWTPGSDTDLAGYFVYRQPVSSSDTSAGPSIRLTPAPVPAPAYRDHTAVAGQRYAYRVSAVDTNGNESAPSADVQETLTEP